MKDWELKYMARSFYPGIEYYKAVLTKMGLSGHKKVLDVGGGYGPIAIALAQLNNMVWMIEPDQERASFCLYIGRILKLKTPVVMVKTIETVVIPKSTFNAIICSRALAYCDDWKKALVKMASLLKTKGVLVISIVTPEFGPAADKEEEDFGIRPTLIEKEDFEAESNKLGLKVDKCDMPGPGVYEYRLQK